MTIVLEGGEWSAARLGHTLPPVKTRYPLYRRVGGPQCRSGGRKSRPTGIRFPDRPTRSQSLYRLSYPAHKLLSRKGNSVNNCEFFSFVLSVRGGQKPLLPVTPSTNPGFVSRTYCFPAFCVDVPSHLPPYLIGVLLLNQTTL